jgi:LmbE family N-acetylglucosaminyl deacetylase
MNRRLASFAVILAAGAMLAGPAKVAARAQMRLQDEGVAGAWQKLAKLQTTASVMHTTAHPDDEHGGVLAWLSRGQGARVSLLTLTRGESGDNAIGPELFDALALVRTEELALAARYYGVDQQYYGTLVDYGFSKRLDETLEKWGAERALADLVRVIRIERPLVIVSRFQGNARDGHGNHSAAGLLSRQAFAKAADPAAFPDQIAGGLRPWQPLKLYMGGVREQEDWTLRVDAGAYDPVQGQSYAAIARLGLSFQRSQNGGRVGSQTGPAFSYYKRLESKVAAPDREQSFFDGIDVTIPGVYRALQRQAPDGAARLLSAIEQEIRAAAGAFTIGDPSASAPALADALAATRDAIRMLGRDADVAHVLSAKESQIADALHAVLGVRLEAAAQPAGAAAPPGPFSGRPAMPPVVPGQTFTVRTTFAPAARAPANLVTAVNDVTLEAGPRWKIVRDSLPADGAAVGAGQFTVTVPEDEPATRPHFSRSSIQDAVYTTADTPARHHAVADAALQARATYTVAGVPLEIRVPVAGVESNVPYGLAFPPLAVVPALSVALTPNHAVVPLAGSGEVTIAVELVNNREAAAKGSVRLAVPRGWTATPASQAFEFLRGGERGRYSFAVRAPAQRSGTHRIAAVASLDGREYREGFQVIRHRDLETRRLYRDAVGVVHGVDLRVAPGLRVGYVMGIGDDVPAAVAQLGADVQLLGERDLASGDLTRFDAIMTGTRAYAVRSDLRTYNRRLLDYVRDGGHLIVLYNTQELVPNLYAPYPGELTAAAEEVSEENSPVEILAPQLPVLTAPNRITAADFQGWVEQRGSKFWASWDSPYTPVVATQDRGQTAQRGGWLQAAYGKGQYTYFAYALHRQLPYGVPGAYRLLANLLSLRAHTR